MKNMKADRRNFYEKEFVKGTINFKLATIFATVLNQDIAELCQHTTKYDLTPSDGKNINAVMGSCYYIDNIDDITVSVLDRLDETSFQTMTKFIFEELIYRIKNLQKEVDATPKTDYDAGMKGDEKPL